jgi:CheY-like chemotaxis protein
MVESIRQKSQDIPVIITTAFGNHDYFITSINLKVDQYLLKPIEEEQAKHVFYKVSLMLEDRKKARELEHIKIQEKINQTSEHVISQIADAYPNPCIIYMDGSIRYINRAFVALFDSAQLIPLLQHNTPLDDLFDKRENYLHYLKDYDAADLSKNKISITRNKGRKIFRILKSELYLDAYDVETLMYTLNDVTWEEYQKVKIKNYTELLEEYIFKNRYSSIRTELLASPSETPPCKETLPVQEAVSESELPKRMIDDTEQEVLRRSHTVKTTAYDYIQELDDDILQELQELHELDDEFESALADLKENGDLSILDTVATKLDAYAHEISLLFQFDDLAYAIRSLSSLLKSLDKQKIDRKTFNRLHTLLNGIQGDLASWRTTLFLEQNALDIHYLDSSLFSACLQIELALSDEIKGIETTEEDFELF